MGDSGGTEEVKRLLREYRWPRSSNSCFSDCFLLGIHIFSTQLQKTAWKMNNFRDSLLQIMHMCILGGEAFAWYTRWQGTGWATIAAVCSSYWNYDCFSTSFLVPLVLDTVLLLHIILTVAHPKMLLEVILYHREIISLLVKDGNLANWCKKLQVCKVWIVTLKITATWSLVSLKN